MNLLIRAMLAGGVFFGWMIIPLAALVMGIDLVPTPQYLEGKLILLVGLGVVEGVVAAFIGNTMRHLS